jgi:putative hydrolase of the HAD superfamily
VTRPAIKAVLWDFGGVILSSPFEAFDAYERELGLPEGFIRSVNATNPDANAWARMERSELDVEGFSVAFEAEARALGGALDGRRVVELLSGAVRPEMVEALRRCGELYRQACLTNNLADGDGAGTGFGGEERRAEIASIMAMFDVVLESSKLGIRKPEPRIYELACERLQVEPAECVFLDDLGVNLKPARAMGMTTIKVVEPDQALGELEVVLGLPLR